MALILRHNVSRFLIRNTLSGVRCFSASASKDMEASHYDVVIAGGGLVGVSLAVSIGLFMFCCKILSFLHT